MNSILTKKKPEKFLTKPLKSNAGRNFFWSNNSSPPRQGRETTLSFGRFWSGKINMTGRIIAIEYDPNRTAFLALVEYNDSSKRYILAPNGLKTGDKIICAPQAEIKTGNRMMLKNIPVGTEVYNIEIEPDKGAKMVRSAGAAARIMAHENKFTQLEMPSKEIRRVKSECFATIGQCSHAEYRFENKNKAGSRRLKGWRPCVRGSAMNPCDHPHGGGEGRTSIGLRYPKTPWGKPALGVKTRSKNKWTNKMIVKRRHKN